MIARQPSSNTSPNNKCSKNVRFNSICSALIALSVGLLTLTAGSLAEAQSVAVVDRIQPGDKAKAAIDGKIMRCIAGVAPSITTASTCPVLKWNGYFYWAFSPTGIGDYLYIRAYDSAGKFVKQWDKAGARYLYDIAMDRTAKTVTFIGQMDKKVTMTMDELFISLAPWHGLASDKWYSIVSKGSSLYLHVTSRSKTPGTELIQWTKENADFEKWKLEPTPDGYFSIINKGSGLYLHVTSRSKTAGTVLIQWTKENADFDKWKLEPTSDGYFSIINKASGLYLHVPSRSKTAGTKLVQWTKEGADFEKWKFE